MNQFFIVSWIAVFIRGLFLRPLIVLILAYLMKFDWDISPLYGMLNVDFKLKVSFFFITLVKFVVATWVLHNLLSWLTQQFKSWNKSEILMVFSGPFFVYIEGLLSVVKAHSIIPALHLSLGFLFFSEKIIQGLLLYVISKVVYRTFVCVDRYLAK